MKTRTPANVVVDDAPSLPLLKVGGGVSLNGFYAGNASMRNAFSSECQVFPCFGIVLDDQPMKILKDSMQKQLSRKNVGKS